MIKQESVQLVIDTARIEEVLGDYLNLKRSGANFKSNCPFHDEKSASFVISPAKGIYKCFGCGQSGNSVKFLMTHEKMGFTDAIRHLAKKYGIRLEETEQTQEEQASRTLKESLLVATEYAAAQFHKNLLESEEGKIVGLSYFNERGILEQTIRDFQLGYCIDSWDHFSTKATKAGYNPDFLVQLGLSKRKDDGSLWDFFKGRIMFPIMNLTGKPIAFGGRTLKKEDKTAKYINSPESEIFTKSKVLFGLHLAKHSIAKEDYCLMVEGYMDVVQLYQAGVRNVVASSGTALTAEQVRLVRRFTQNMYILYDGDKAGIKAALRGMEIVLEQGMNVKIALLPDGHDPDSYVKEFGGEAFKQYLSENAKDIITFKALLFKEEAGSDPVKKSELVRDMIRTIALVQEPIKRNFYIKECSLLMDVSEALLSKETQKTYIKTIKEKDERQKQEQSAQIDQTLDLIAQEEQMIQAWDAASMILNRRRKIEVEICRILLEYGDRIYEESDNPFDLDSNINVMELVFKVEGLDNIKFEDESCAKVYEAIRKNYFEGKVFPFKHYSNHPDPDIAEFAVRHCFKYENEVLMRWGKKGNEIALKDYGHNFKKEIKDALEKLYLSGLDKMSMQIIEFVKHQKSNEIDGDTSKFFEYQKQLIAEYQRLSQNVQDVFRTWG